MISSGTTVDVVGLSSKEVYDFMLTCTDEQYQHW